MQNDVFLSGTGNSTLNYLSNIFDDDEVGTLFIASAYITSSGVEMIEELLSNHDVDSCGIIFGTDGFVTTPKAIEKIDEFGWNSRVVESQDYIFHPKFALTGGLPPKPFSEEVYAGYVGSANFTGGGLEGNIEVGVIIREKVLLTKLIHFGKELVEISTPVDEFDLEQYADDYAKEARKRSWTSTSPGVGETNRADSNGLDSTPNYDPRYAEAAWVGMDTSTGDYTYQLGLPQKVASVILAMIEGDQEECDVLCSDDIIRTMSLKFYSDNQMHRINIPNDVPGISRAREEGEGFALFERIDRDEVDFQLTILHDEETQQELIGRSSNEGTIEETPTRLYGWF